jgi:heme exporter protein D
MPEFYFESLSAFWQMGGYALFVWLSFGSTYGLLAALWWFSQRSQSRILQDLSKKQQREHRVRAQQQLEEEHDESKT